MISRTLTARATGKYCSFQFEMLTMGTIEDRLTFSFQNMC